MGFLTPILIRNDCLHSLISDPDTLNNIQEACTTGQEMSFSSYEYDRSKPWQFWKKPRIRCASGDAISSLGTDHASNTRVIVISGNSWVDLGHEYLKRKFKDTGVRMDKVMLDCLKEDAKAAKAAAQDLLKFIEAYEKERENE